MKLKNGQNKILSLAGVSILCICSGFSIDGPFPVKKLSGTWYYKAIYKNGINILIPSPKDSMHLNSKNSGFHYHIQSLNKNLVGRYTLIQVPLDSSPYKKALQFEYSPNSSIRKFNIMLISDSLIIREGNTFFHYSRKKL
jgi:hypothetical protein